MLNSSSPFQVLPSLSEEEFESLKADIALRGVLVPVEKDEKGNILDGHHRVRACEELGIEDYPVLIRVGMGEAEKREHARVLNNARRHLNAEKKRAQIEEVLKENPQLSDRQIARIIGVSDKTVAAVRGELVSGAEIPHLTHTVGKDGKTYPTSRPSTVMAASAAQAQKAMDMIEARPEIMEAPTQAPLTLTVQDVAKATKQAQIEEVKTSYQRLGKAEGGKALAYQIEAGRLLSGLPEATADLLLTDPPYSTDVEDVESFAHSWLPLALSRVKSTGRAYVCVGAYPEELQAYLTAPRAGFELAQVLVWTYRNTLGPTPARLYKLNWQAILYFVGKDAPDLDCPVMVEQFSVQDIAAPDGRIGNRYHAWQKPDELAERFIRHSTQEGALVLDPFCCTGTFLAAAARLGRDAIGCDIDPAALEIASARGVIVREWMGQ